MNSKSFIFLAKKRDSVFCDRNTFVVAAVVEMQPQGETEVKTTWFRDGTISEESP